MDRYMHMIIEDEDLFQFNKRGGVYGTVESVHRSKIGVKTI